MRVLRSRRPNGRKPKAAGRSGGCAVEGLGGNAQASRAWKGVKRDGNVWISVGRPDSMCESGFLFCDACGEADIEEGFLATLGMTISS